MFVYVIADATVIKTAAGTGGEKGDKNPDEEEEKEPDPDAVLDGELSRYLLTEEEQKKRYNIYIEEENIYIHTYMHTTLFLMYFFYSTVICILASYCTIIIA